MENERMTLNVPDEELERISNETGAKISKSGDVIELSGDEAEVDSAIGEINALGLKNDLSDEDEELYEEALSHEINVGDKFSTRTNKNYGQYSTFEVLSYDSQSDICRCYETEYAGSGRNWQTTYRDYCTMRGSDLQKMRKMRKRR